VAVAHGKAIEDEVADPMPRKLLLVDDEPHILSSVRRHLGAHFHITCAGNGEEALRLFDEEGPFPVIVSDMRMPVMDGLELLRILRRRAPDTVCLLLSGQTDFNTLVDALNEGEIFRFLGKPASPDLLRATLERAYLEHERLKRNPRLPVEGGRLIEDAGALRRGIAEGQLRLFVQPQARLADGAVTGAEGLARWAHPERGLLHPGLFFDALEAGGLSAKLMSWGLDSAAGVLRSWRGTPAEALHLAVNLSPADLADPGFLPALETALKAYGGPEERLELELTEQAAIADDAAIRQVMASAASLGVRWSIDDFGTGYSSFGWLRRLPVSKVKIDRVFVEDIAEDPQALRIVKGIAEMVHDLGCQVVAEGAEHPEQLDLLAQCGCDLIQGYALARPMPADRLLEWLEERRGA
jgi:EAL domain-containing protein (putative c-di-GMP-specific phosphodiesterase class I)/CheY-like chemotaxis protein